jgi:heme exporter protein D
MTARIAHFLAMGGYAQYVWPAFAVAILVLGGMLGQSLATYRRLRRELDAIERARPRRGRR